MGLDEALHALALSRLRSSLEKNAGFWQAFQEGVKRSFTGEGLGTQVATGLTAAGTGAAITGLGLGAKTGFEAIRERIEKPKLYQQMLESAPGLAKQDPRAVQMTFNTLYSLNRSLARDPLVASSFVSRNMTRADVGDGAGAYIDPQTAKLLMDAGAKRDDAGPVFKAWQQGAAAKREKEKVHETGSETQGTLPRQPRGNPPARSLGRWRTLPGDPVR